MGKVPKIFSRAPHRLAWPLIVCSYLYHKCSVEFVTHDFKYAVSFDRDELAEGTSYVLNFSLRNKSLLEKKATKQAFEKL